MDEIIAMLSLIYENLMCQFARKAELSIDNGGKGVWLVKNF